VTDVTRKPNGEKCPVTNLKDGNGVVVFYNEDGTEDFRFTYKDGERVRD
jgi:antitoxin component YwqK of YwqJK toxin-antitoxin module